jgi:hypothetical protein
MHSVQNAHMKKPVNTDCISDQAQRLRDARKTRGFEDAHAAATYFNWNYSTYSQHERGLRGLRTEVAKKYAKSLRVDAGWLLTGKGSDKSAGDLSTANSIDEDKLRKLLRCTLELFGAEEPEQTIDIILAVSKDGKPLADGSTDEALFLGRINQVRLVSVRERRQKDVP